jgi:hypothetical protein
MHLSVKALGITGALLWGGAMLVLGIAHLASASYAAEFLKVISSIYPGYHATQTVGDVVLGTCYALVDGGVGGLIFAWVYNQSVARVG